MSGVEQLGIGGDAGDNPRDGDVIWDRLAEQSALGGAMLSASAVWDVLEAVTPSEFYLPRHEYIARAIGQLTHAKQPVDVISVTNALATAGLLERAGGAAYVHELTSVVPTASNAGFYAGIVHDLAIRRRLTEAGLQVVAMGRSSEGNALQLVERAQAAVDSVTKGATVEVRPIGDSFESMIESLSAEPRFVETPWRDLNEYIGGLRPGALYVVGARPAQGKTIIGLQLAVQLAARQGAVAFASLEMSESDLQKRLVAQFANINLSSLVNNEMSDDDWNAFAGVRSKLVSAPIYIDDRPGTDIMQIKAFARSVSRKAKLAGVVVDYLQLMQSPDSSKSRQEVVADFSRGLKVLARDLDVPVVALSQLNRAPEARSTKTPTLADLRESGAIEQDADVVMLLSHDDKDAKRRHLLDMHVAKNRHGGTGKLELLWEGQFARVRSLSTVWTPTSSLRDDPRLVED